MSEIPEDVGIIVGRFQTPELHEGHKSLFDKVLAKHERVLVFLGLSPNKRSRKDPLDFEARRLMVLESYPDVSIHPISDVNGDEVWSRLLDIKIREIIPFASVRLYGGRDSFIARYKGNLPTTEVESNIYRSATALRNAAGHNLKGDRGWRAGVIYGAFNQFPKTWQTVDVAPTRDTPDGFVEVLLARKPGEVEWRFIGGFADPRDTSLEMTARREVEEEAHIAVDGLEYVGSSQIDDWRYRDDVDKVLTTFFAAHYVSGSPRPDDDISDLGWFTSNRDSKQSLHQVAIVSAHTNLFAMFMAYLKRKQNAKVSANQSSTTE